MRRAADMVHDFELSWQWIFKHCGAHLPCVHAASLQSQQCSAPCSRSHLLLDQPLWQPAAAKRWEMHDICPARVPARRWLHRSPLAGRLHKSAPPVCMTSRWCGACTTNKQQSQRGSACRHRQTGKIRTCRCNNSQSAHHGVRNTDKLTWLHM